MSSFQSIRKAIVIMFGVGRLRYLRTQSKAKRDFGRKVVSCVLDEDAIYSLYGVLCSATEPEGQ